MTVFRTDTSEPGGVSAVCSGATGREGPAHNFIRVTDSSYRPAPYLRCPKCGVIVEIGK